MSDANTQESHVPDYPRGISFEQVWAALMEDREHQKKRSEEFDREMKERRDEFDRAMKERREEFDRTMRESREEFDRRMQKSDKRFEETRQIVGKLGNSIGGLVETLFAARLWEKFSSYPYDFKRVYQNMPVYKPDTTRALTEIDLLLSNNEWAMAVEVKRRMLKEDVTDHLIRMDRIIKYPPAEVKGKKLLGAMAGGTIEPHALELAYESGFFVLELKGESVKLLTPPEGFKPREWLTKS